METLLVLESGSQVYREYALRALAEKYAIVLLHHEPLSWQKPYIIDDVRVALTDESSVLEAAGQMVQKYSFAGVFTYDEPSVEIATLVAQVLHLPHNDRETMQACRDKHLMRERWQQKGVLSAQSHLCISLEEARIAAEKIGFPVVLKPRAMAASIGVLRADNMDELKHAYLVANKTHPMFKKGQQGILVEEYLDGPEVSVECAIYNGLVHIVAITRKRTGLAPFFEETDHIVSPDEPLEAEQAIRELIVAAHQALDFKMGVTHAEVRLTPNGPRMVEINARVAGDFIPLLVSLAYGIDLTTVGADIATGKDPQLQPRGISAAAIHFVYPDQDVKVRTLEINPAAPALTWIDRAGWFVRPGEEVRLPPHNYVSRLGFIVVTGRSVLECEQHIKTALALLQIDVVPLNVH